MRKQPRRKNYFCSRLPAPFAQTIKQDLYTCHHTNTLLNHEYSNCIFFVAFSPSLCTFSSDFSSTADDSAIIFLTLLSSLHTYERILFSCIAFLPHTHSKISFSSSDATILSSPSSRTTHYRHFNFVCF